MNIKLLNLIEKNSRLSNAEIASMLNMKEDEVKKEIDLMISENIICGFNTLINWDKTNKDIVTALIEVKIAPQRDQGFDKIAKAIYHYDEVISCYLMSGGFDLTVIIKGNNIKEVAHFVSSKLSTIDSVLATSTHFVLKNYKDHDIVIEGTRLEDGRMIVSP